VPRQELVWLGLGWTLLWTWGVQAAAPTSGVPSLRLPTARWVAESVPPEKGLGGGVLHAIASGDTAAVATSIDRGGGWNTLGPVLQDGLLVSPLSLAVAGGNVTMVKTLLDAGGSPNGPAGTRPPLWNAALGCHIEIARLLINHGASVNLRRGTDGVTPLLAACQGACPSVARLLIDYGANPHAETSGGITPLMAAAWWGSTSVLGELLRHDPDLLATDHAGHDGVYFAALRGHAASLRLLLEAGSQADRATVHGWTALMAAARSGCTPCVTLLLDHHADPNAALPGGRSPMQEAARHCHADVMKQLLAAGASLGITSARWPALDEAIRSSCPDAMRVLLESDAAVHSGRHHVTAAAHKIAGEVNAAADAPSVQARLAECQQVLDAAEKRAREAF
jgi:ankyrin repeat protein